MLPILALGYSAVHARLVPNAVIILGDAKPGWLSRIQLTAVSFVVKVAASLAAALIFPLISRKLGASS
jgi:hypothetical protein